MNILHAGYHCEMIIRCIYISGNPSGLHRLVENTSPVMSAHPVRDASRRDAETPIYMCSIQNRAARSIINQSHFPQLRRIIHNDFVATASGTGSILARKKSGTDAVAAQWYRCNKIIHN
jgi:hypothetical protein